MSGLVAVRVDHSDAVRGFLNAANFKYAEDSAMRVFNLRFQAQDVLVDLSFFTGDGYISVHARLPNLVSEAQISGTTALLNAITRSIAVGSFELAKAIPIIDFKSGFIATDTHVSVELIKQCFDSCVYHVNFCYPVVSAFLAKSISLGQALEWADANWNDKPTLEFGK